MPATTRTGHIDLQSVLDGMNQAVLIFAADGALLLDNLAARRMLGAHLARIRAGGWTACAALIDAGRDADAPPANTVRAQALRSAEPVAFFTRLGGAYLPGSLASIYQRDGQVLTQLCLQGPGWTPFTRMLDTFLAEACTVINATRGHADLTDRLLAKHRDQADGGRLAAQVAGFVKVIGSHMYRLEALVRLLQRLGVIVTGRLAADVSAHARRLPLDAWLEDLVESLSDGDLVDPDSGREGYAGRVALEVPQGLCAFASASHLREVLRDLLSNAVLYSANDAPVRVQAAPAEEGRFVRISVIDQGCGIRLREAERVFAPFQRARQPQVIGQFGYGLSLYVAQIEVEAMGGQLAYESEEGVGSTFSVTLPAAGVPSHPHRRAPRAPNDDVRII